MHERVFAWDAKVNRASCHVVLCGEVTTSIYSCKTHRRTIVDRDRASHERFRKSGPDGNTVASALAENGYACGPKRALRRNGPSPRRAPGAQSPCNGAVAPSRVRARRPQQAFSSPAFRPVRGLSNS
jgi:hypothetical protein